MSEGKKLLAVMAHPDDETFGIGGTLAYYAKQKVEVSLICATKGEAGEVDPVFLEGFSSVADLRESELKCAADTLGIKNLHFLNYRDSGMLGSKDNEHPRALINAPLEKVAEDISQIIQKVKPQVIITFDEIGGYFHIDHIKIHQTTKMAFYQLIKSTDARLFRPDKLYLYTIPKTTMKFIVKIVPLLGKDPRRFGQNKDIDLVKITEHDFPIHAKIKYSRVKKERLSASQCYASQGGENVNKGAAGLLRGWSGPFEYFIREYPEPNSSIIENDLFTNLTNSQ